MTYVDSPVLPELHELLMRRWPFEPEAITVVDGAMDALDRITAAWRECAPFLAWLEQYVGPSEMPPDDRW